MSTMRVNFAAMTKRPTPPSRSPLGRASFDTQPMVEAPGRSRSKRPSEPAQPKNSTAASSERQGTAIDDTQPNQGSPLPDARNLIGLVKFWEEQQRHRIRMGNQLWSIENEEGVAPPEMTAAHHGMLEIEKGLEKSIVREWRKHPLAPWQAQVRGLGDHSCAVLVALLDGDPYVAYPKKQITKAEAKHLGLPIPKTRDGREMERWIVSSGEPRARTVAQLWSFCGVGAPARREKGMSQEAVLAMGKPVAKSRVWQIANHFNKSNNPEYRAIYVSARADIADRTHAVECPRCGGKKGKAAPIGSPWKEGHQHAHALRIVAKRFLQDLWCEAKRLHDAAMRGTDPMLPAPHPNDDDGHGSHDTHGRDAVASSPPA